jgi:cob(I)alamin adenosyltransferase
MRMNSTGFVQVYTGNGKGKTTAAIGLAIRALGAGKKVMFLQFMKAKVYSEHSILPEVSPNLTLQTIGKPFFVVKEGTMSPEEEAQWRDKAVFFPPGKPPQEYLEIIAGGMEKAREATTSGKYDLVVLDELNVALHFGLVSWEEVKDLIEKRAKGVEVVLTGRGATPELIETADLVTEMREIKHYYNTQGIEARKGIEN